MLVSHFSEIEISRTVPHRTTFFFKETMILVPEKENCLSGHFTYPKGASWQESADSILLRLLQTGHDQKFLYT